LVALAALCVPLACGQVFPTAAETAQVDALVTNAEGLPVLDLTAADFEILRNNVPQQVLSAAYVRNPRTVLLVVDDLGLALDGINAVRAALGKFVDEQMRPGDRAAIVRTGVGGGAVQTFTGAKDLLHAAIDQVKCQPARVAGRLDDQRLDGQSLNGQNLDDKSQNGFGAGSRAGLRFAVDGLRQLRGRKAVVVLSSHLAMFRNALESAGRLADSANQAGAVLYGFDPGVDPGVGPIGAGDSIAAASFMVLAEQTGGAVMAPDAGLSNALDRVLREQDGYYLIDYHPAASLTPLAGTLAVRVKHAGLLVRSRTGPMLKPADGQGVTQKTRREEILGPFRNPSPRPPSVSG
jgi:VWFA-related protein